MSCHTEENKHKTSMIFIPSRAPGDHSNVEMPFAGIDFLSRSLKCCVS